MQPFIAECKNKIGVNVEHAETFAKAVIIKKDHRLFPNDLVIDWAIDHACSRGYVITDNYELILRKDIFDTLENAFLKECAESDANLIATHGREAFDELTTILKKNQERDFNKSDRCITK